MAQWQSIPDLEDTSPRAGGALLPVLQIVVPLAVATLLWLWAHVTMAIIVLVVGGTIVIATKVSPAADRAIARASAWLGRVVGGALSMILLGGVYIVVFGLISLVLRMLGRDPMHSEPDPARASYWGRLGGENHRPMVRWQFAMEPRDESGRAKPSLVRGMVSLVATLFVINLVGGIVLHAIGWAEPRPLDFRAKLPAYEGEDWVKKYYRELSASGDTDYVGFLGWRRADFDGDHINIEGGIRHTYPGAGEASSEEPLRVFFFGGSTMWGTGNRDDHTIPSEFVRLAEADGVQVDVTNFGEKGYVSWQEVLTLAERCAAGDVPDIAIFYDGVNDVFAQMQYPSAKPLPQNFPQLRGRFENAYALWPSLVRYSAVTILFKHMMSGQGPRPGMKVEKLPKTVDELAANASSIYLQNIEHARRLGEAYDFEVRTFWQPCAYTKNPVHEDEKAQRKEFAPALEEVYMKTTEAVGSATTSITDALDGLEGPIMIDWCHTNEAGARAVAEAIYTRVKPTLTTSTRRDG